ncbi:MAG: tetratricopeptide repeat protein [Planctomycetota bacterium]|nr:tetratricopeptide repeat protein [Planctomycetota bacterium]
MNCGQFQSSLGLVQLDILKESERSDLDAHLKVCGACQLVSDEVNSAYEMLRDMSDEQAFKPDSLWAGIKMNIKKDVGVTDTATVTIQPTKPILIALSCSYCHDSLARGEARYCASCLAPHHSDCFRSHGHCSAMGCEETLTVKPQGIEISTPGQRSRTTTRGSRKFVLAMIISMGVSTLGLVGHQLIQSQRSAQVMQEEALLEAHSRVRELEGQVEAALPIKGLSREARLARAELNRLKRNYTEALKDVEVILKNAENDPGALVLRAHVLLDLNHTDGTMRDLRKVLASDKDNAMALGLRSHVKLLNGDRVGSLADSNAAIEIDLDGYYPYRVRGEIRLTAEEADLVGAEDDFRNAVRLAPQISDNHYWYGRLLQEKDDKEGALRAYAQCLDLDKKNWRAYCNRDTIRRLLHDYDNALRDLDKAIALQPKNGHIFLQRSKIRWVRLRKGGIDYREAQWDDVMSDLNESIRLQPYLPDAYGRRGFIHRRRKKFKEALSDYNRAINLEPEDVYVWYGYRGLLYAEYNESKKGIEDLTQYLESAPSTHQIFNRVQKERSRLRREIEKRE